MGILTSDSSILCVSNLMNATIRVIYIYEIYLSPQNAISLCKKSDTNL